VLLVYEELVAYIQNNPIEGCVSSKQSKSTHSKAKKTLCNTIWRNVTNRKKLKSMFDYHVKCATPYYRFYRHYGNVVLAMIPTKIREGDMHCSPAVLTIFLEVLDIVRPDLHGPRLRFFSSLIGELALERVPSERVLEKLGRWTSPDAISSFNVNADISSVLDVTSKTNNCDDLCYESIYKSEADKQHILGLREFQHDVILTERYRMLQLKQQDQSLMAKLRDALTSGGGWARVRS